MLQFLGNLGPDPAWLVQPALQSGRVNQTIFVFLGPNFLSNLGVLGTLNFGILWHLRTYSVLNFMLFGTY